ncbi:hypothetical protein SAY86_002230 [Trapa natans]|uniref:Uncharacterized protein n=1 Tax=Trapa natans TaxID=22666 RepID=A0AAN7LS22_TRANT|nr:hypothetical protein SAY86_002230 [Trapa natans]
MAGVLQERVEPKLAISRWFRHNRNNHNQVLSRPYRGRCEELSIRSEAQEVIARKQFGGFIMGTTSASLPPHSLDYLN